MTIAVTGALALALTGVGAGGAMAVTSHPASSISTVSAVHPLSSSTAGAETSTTESTTEAPESAATSDGPGGHADAENVDVNHQGGANEQ
ncbi:MAG TPA: hypothetical protein VGC94_01675 [Amnibacterium sp.]